MSSPDTRGIPLNIGRVTTTGVVVTYQSHLRGVGPFDHSPVGIVYNACRTVLGGPTRVQNPRQVCLNVKKKRWRKRSDLANGSILVPYEFALLIVQYEKIAAETQSLRAYAGMSLQEFLTRTWNHSGL